MLGIATRQVPYVGGLNVHPHHDPPAVSNVIGSTTE
jgi:hypothetical protein